ncbi:AraC family transcriptional regulator [Salinarimonas chemoclinalis]|uniref:AraC family transcriptional regulator n=1 Tax=Salinarimonas chemoclinalis TaxID=3241599 RepID=UPI00355738AF
MFSIVELRSAGLADRVDTLTRLRLVIPQGPGATVVSVDGAAVGLAQTEAILIGAGRYLSVSSAAPALALEIGTDDPDEAHRIRAICADAEARRLPLDRSLRLLRDFVTASPGALQERDAAHAWASLALHAIANAAPPWPRALHAAVDHIERHLQEPLSIDSIAAASAVSRRTLHDLFHRHLGDSPYAFLSRRRIERALDMLVGDPNLSIAAIAHATGHKDQSALTRAVRARCDTTPGAYRKRHLARNIGIACPIDRNL